MYSSLKFRAGMNQATATIKGNLSNKLQFIANQSPPSLKHRFYTLRLSKKIIVRKQ